MLTLRGLLGSWARRVWGILLVVVGILSVAVATTLLVVDDLMEALPLAILGPLLIFLGWRRRRVGIVGRS